MCHGATGYCFSSYSEGDIEHLSASFPHGGKSVAHVNVKKTLTWASPWSLMTMGVEEAEYSAFIYKQKSVFLCDSGFNELKFKVTLL